MEEDYPSIYRNLKRWAGKLTRELRGPMSAFAQLNATTTAPGALDAKTKQLIALAIAISSRCEGCIAYHIQDAVRAGASREDIMETVGISILMGGGPAVIFASEVLKAMDQFEHAGLPSA